MSAAIYSYITVPLVVPMLYIQVVETNRGTMVNTTESGRCSCASLNGMFIYLPLQLGTRRGRENKT